MIMCFHFQHMVFNLVSMVIFISINVTWLYRTKNYPRSLMSLIFFYLSSFSLLIWPKGGYAIIWMFWTIKNMEMTKQFNTVCKHENQEYFSCLHFMLSIYMPLRNYYNSLFSQKKEKKKKFTIIVLSYLLEAKVS